MELIDVMRHRRSIRKYTDEIIDDAAINKVLQAGLLSPSSHNSKPWEFIVIKDKDTLMKLSNCRIGASFMIKNANCAIVVLGDEEESDIWMDDSAIVMTNMHLMASSLGIGSCWVHGRKRLDASGRSTDSYVRNILHFPNHMKLEAMLALGMPGEKKTPYNLEDLPYDKIHIEMY